MERVQTYKEHQTYGFRNGLREIHDAVIKPCGLDHIAFGPTYNVQTSQGASLHIHTVKSMIPLVDASLGNEADMIWLFFAQDEQGNLIGYRKAALQKKNDPGLGRYWYRVGDIATARRGEGIAMTLELAHADLMKRIAVINWMPVLCYVEDGNKMQLREMEFDLRENTTNKPLEALVLEKRKEHERWMRMYGPNGLFGYDNYGELLIVRKDADFLYEVPLETIDTITLNRADEKALGLEGVFPLFDDMQLDPETIRKKKKKKYTKDIIPQIEHILE